MGTRRFGLSTLSILLFIAVPVVAQEGPPENNAAKGPMTHGVTVSSNMFSPSNLTINPGDTVVWTNVGGIHNVDSDDGTFGSGDPIGAPWEFEFTFGENHAGANPYHCDRHGGPGGAGMSGIINVTGGVPEYSSNPANDGTIAFGNVQQGVIGPANLTVMNTGTDTLTISNVVISNDTADIFDVNPGDTSFDVAQDTTHFVDFTCSPTLATPPGQKTQAQVTVSTNDSDEPTVDYTLDCNVTAAPGDDDDDDDDDDDGDDDDDDDDDSDPFPINYGHSGSWAHLATLGQGWLFEIIPGFNPPVLVAYNFTYPLAGVVKGGDPVFSGNQMWLVGAGEINVDTATIMSDRPIAGVFDDPAPPFFPAMPYATFVFTFFDCINAMVSYDIPSKNLKGEYPIERITPDVLCEELAAQP